MGECAAPFLADALRTERDQTRTMLLIGAYGLATRRPAEVLLHLARPKERKDRRLVALLLLAMAPRQAGSGSELGRLLDRGSPLDRVGAALALSRFETTELPDAGFFDRERDVGAFAAGVYCRPVLRRGELEARVRRFEGTGHESLIWRAYLLGRAVKSVDAERRAVAVERLTDPGARPGRLEAACCLARDPNATLTEDQLRAAPLELKVLLCGSPLLRARILRSAELELRGMAEKTLQRRFLVLVARCAPGDRLREALAAWKEHAEFREERTRSAVWLALAWRVLAQPAASRPFDLATLGLRPDEGRWLRWALGGGVDAAARQEIDPELGRAFPLATSGRLQRVDVAAAVEAALWRLGVHPGLAELEVHRQLLAELLIDGSQVAGTRFAEVSRKAPYVAKGLLRDDAAFRIAHELFKFIRREEPWALREHRLRD